MEILLISSFQEVFLLKDSKLRFRLCGRIVGFRPQLEPIYMSPEVITTRLEDPLLSVYSDCIRIIAQWNELN